MREGTEWSHDLLDHHIEHIKTTFPELDVVVARGEEIQKEAQDADIFAGFPVRIPKVEDGMQVKWIHSFSAGVDHVLTPEIKANDDIVVSNSSGIHAVPISEHIVGMILAYNQRFPVLFKNQTEKKWERAIPTTELHGKTVVIVGLGAIGSETARLLSIFNCIVYGVVRTIRETPEGIKKLYTAETMSEILPEADYVIICLPGSFETKGMFDAKIFSQMKQDSVLVNIGRGTIVNQDDLIKALQEKTIGGALLDVATPEPLPENSPLWEMDNVIITPHCSGSTPKSMDRIIDRLCLNIRAFLDGKELPNKVDKELGY